jgi:signal transduction histidine kinase
MRRAFVPDVIENRIAAVQIAAQRLRSLNRLIADSLESLPESALVTNPDGCILLANSSADRLFRARRTAVDPSRGRAPDKPLEGRDVVDLLVNFSTPGVTSWRHAWIDAYEETRAVTYEVNGPREREYLLQISPLFSSRGPQTGSIVTMVDISPLRESERARDEALRFLSHDMRSPQASILTLLEMYADDPRSIPTNMLTTRIGNYARRTLNLADDFLRLARAERISAADFEELDLADLMQDAVDEAWVAASAKSISIHTKCDLAEAMVKGDRDLLTRALMNLLSNAIKYSPAETSIRCSIEASGDQWVARVADQGYGIAPGNLSRLFTRYVRLRSEGRPEESGIGLGLVFVKTVAERHGGSVSVTSQISDASNGQHGTTFSITLPKSS